MAVGLSILAVLERPSCAQEPQHGKHKYTNELIHSTSPYLLQHAHNPVNWLPWGPAAFAKAKAENKPVFVSIGYSTCYWCHVMERESFENEQVAQILNEHYIAIKVDREERPDIDEQLMLATQLMTGRGGWPNSVWLTSDGRPWMAGTYFPREQFSSALLGLSNVWRTQAEAVQKQANSLSDAIRQASRVDLSENEHALDRSPLQRALAELSQIYDSTNGGFGSQPKFPPHGVLRLLAVAAEEDQPEAKRMLTHTLDAMWCGGVHDHVGGGFHRYSTDERWFLPHFEKMLYDNAQLIRALTEAYAVTQESRYRVAVEDIFAWLGREMTHEQGGFYSAIDSESEGGEEGRFYTWSMTELREVLGEDDADYFAQTYHFQPEGNFTEEATGHRPGTNIPYLQIDQLASDNERLAKLRAALRQARAKREYPHLDDKVLTSWNGLMISALARAGKVFDEPRYTEAAQKAARFILDELQVEGKLQRTWRDGRASLPGYLNDYAFFAEGLVELHEATGDPAWHTEATRLANEMLDQFEDRENGGFYFTSEEHEALLLRSKNLTGGGNLPVGNGVAVQVLLKLDAMSKGDHFWRAAERALQSFSGLMRSSPRQVEHLVLANAIYLRLKDSRQAPTGDAEGDLPEDRYQDAVLQADLFLSHSSAAPGQEIQLAVQLEISPRFHVYGPAEEGVVSPTTIILQTNEAVLAGDLIRPKGRNEFDPVLQRRLTTYEGKATFFLPLRIKEAATLGDADLLVHVSFQACDDKQCLAPQRAPLKAKLRVTKERQDTLRHPGVFEHDGPGGD